MSNHYLRVSIVSAVITVILFGAVFAPEKFGADMMQYGYALSFLLGFLGVCALITSLVYAKYARQMNQVLNGENVLAHWKYSDIEWSNHAKQEYSTDKEYKGALLMTITFWAVLFAILFPVLDREDGIYVSYAMTGLVALMTVVALLSTLYSKIRSGKKKGQVLISTEGVLINGQMHLWSVFPSHLSSVRLKKKDELSVLEFSIFTGRSGNFFVRAPVPKDVNEEDVGKILKTLNQ